MTRLFAAVLLVHGLIHLLGVAAAFGADVPALRRPISPSMGALWLAGALFFVATAAALMLWPRWWWAVGAVAIVVSSVAVATSWSDAKFGALVNAIAVVGVVFGFLALGPVSLRAAYEHDVDRTLVPGASDTIVTEADLAPLPAPVQRYLRASGVVGHPRVASVRVRMHGRIRSAPDAPWMPFEAEQYNRFDRRSRLFYLTASRAFVPIQGYHRYVDDEASMLVKAAALVPVAKGEGREMTRAETVTLFNDMCLLAPATLVDPSIAWEPVSDRTVRAAFTNAGHTIRAGLSFNEAGDLVDFSSDDRGRGDGRSLTPTRWSTPVTAYRTFGPYRVIAGGDARWHDARGEWPYIEITIDDVAFNVERRSERRATR
jgi:hypothetical protein